MYTVKKENAHACATPEENTGSDGIVLLLSKLVI